MTSSPLGISQSTGQQTLGDSIPPLSVATPSRVFGTAFQPSATRPVLCIYTVQIAAAFSLTSGQTGTVQFLSDSSNPPVTVRNVTSSGLSGSLTVGLNMTNTQQAVIVYLVPAGDFVKLVSSGTATITLVQQVEVTF